MSPSLAVLRAGHPPLGTSVVLASCCPSSSKPGSCLYSRHSKHTCRCMLTCKSAYERSTTAHRLHVSILAIYKSYTQSPSASLQSIPRADRDHIICQQFLVRLFQPHSSSIFFFVIFIQVLDVLFLLTSTDLNWTWPHVSPSKLRQIFVGLIYVLVLTSSCAILVNFII